MDYKRYSEMLEDLIAHIDLKEELKAVVEANINLARVMCGVDKSEEKMMEAAEAYAESVGYKDEHDLISILNVFCAGWRATIRKEDKQ